MIRLSAAEGKRHVWNELSLHKMTVQNTPAGPISACILILRAEAVKYMVEGLLVKNNAENADSLDASSRLRTTLADEDDCGETCQHQKPFLPQSTGDVM